jgi:hypothetical protein
MPRNCFLPSFSTRHDAGVAPIVLDAPRDVNGGDIRFNLASSGQQQLNASPVAS